MSGNDAGKLMETLYWWGIPTLFRCPADTDPASGARGLNVIGGDVVCLMPTKDSPNNITAMVAAYMMFEIVSLIADRKRQAA